MKLRSVCARVACLLRTSSRLQCRNLVSASTKASAIGCALLPAFLVCLSLAGCTQDDDYRVPTVEEADTPPADAHAHHEHGPHGGSIVELGTHDLHAEAVLDEAESRLDIYILGGDAETAQAIDAESLTLSFKHGDETEDFELAAAPQEGDAEGTSSKFSITSEDLSQELHHHAEGAALQFMADGIAYTGTVVHDHDHGHGEEHGHDEGHEVGEDSDDGPEAPATQEETSDAVKPEANTEAAETPVENPEAPAEAAPVEAESTEAAPATSDDAE